MKNAGPSQRQLRVAEQVRHAVAHILQRDVLLDDVLKNVVISVSEVRMSPDLKLLLALYRLSARLKILPIPMLLMLSINIVVFSVEKSVIHYDK